DGISPGRFYQNGDTNQPLYIDSEDPIMRGSGSDEFDQEGSSNTQDIGGNFPKGHTGFFCMKHKITANQYIEFLNCLSRGQQNNRTLTDISGTSIVNRFVLTNTASPTNRNPVSCNAELGTNAVTFFADLDNDGI
ncbi:MAG: hypothetical protein AAGK97_16685, partial [Bacteroidota bacterium]